MADTNDQPMTDVNSPANNNNDDDPSIYLSSLSEPLKSYAIKAFSPPPTTSEDTTATDNDDTTTKRLDELEISTRSHLLTLVEQLHSITHDNNNDDQQSAISPAIETILDYLNSVTLLCLHVTRQHSTTTVSQYYKHLTNISIIKKLPFLLLEDTIDSLPLQHIQTIWSSPQYSSKTISSLTTSNKLTSPHIFTPPSKLILLRICNKILKLLSNSNIDSEFAGTIMILLTKVFPLSERSAINVLGSFNVWNETVFEDEVEFNEKHTAAEGGDSENNKGDGKGSSRSGNNIGYDFYKTFWGVQRIFTDPTSTILSSKNNGLSQSNAANAYNSFMKDITSILVALESSTPVSNSSKEEETSSTTKTEEETTTVRHHKYLTSSQLLHLQLKDVQLRIHFLTQLLIILSYLSSPTVTLPTGVASTAGSNTEKLSNQIKVAQMKQLSLIEKRAMVLLQCTTPPVGENMLKCLKWILKEREIIWRNWKRFKCNPALDKVGSVLGSSGVDVKNKLLVGKKRKADQVAALEAKSKGKKMKDDDAIQISDLAQDTASQDQDTVLPPTLKTFLEPYTDALDPENGIEGEYHPRNDSVYSWRALRLMARDQDDSGQLNKFDKIRRKDGDFEGMVRDMAKEKEDAIGGTLPEDYYAEEPDDDVPEKKVDVDMGDAASVGTPEEETIAKKEQMEEFERAAMEVEDDLLNDKDDGKEKGVEVKSGEKAEPVKKEDSGVKKDMKDDKKSEEKGDVATETASSTLNGQEKKKEEPKKSNAAEKKKEVVTKKDEPRKKKSPDKKNDKKKKEEPKKGKEDNSKSKDNGKSKRGGGKSQPKENDAKKDSKKDTKSDNNGKKTGRAKFTPPEGEKAKQKDEAIRNSSSRGRQSGGRRGSERNERQQQQPDRNDHGHRRDNSTDGRRSQIPAPSHNRSLSRDGRDNQRGNSSNDIGRDTSRGRDAKSRSPPNDGGGRNAPRSAQQGGWQPPPQGRGASQGRGAPQRGGRGGGRGRGSRR